LEELVCYCKEHSEAELMADIATISEAKRAETLGFNYIGCTLRSYTEETAGIEIPDYDFIQELISTISNSKVIVEGGIWEKSQLKVILKMNPYAVVIGSSITRPMDITKRFNEVFKQDE
ncbi:MAG: N-acetylmannosamine-6-phosphate 2-epimerase, partial [Clostridia bacterium]